MSQFVSLRIKEVVQETPEAVSLVFDIPAKDQSNFSFIPGQFITLKAEINGEEVRRAYSISSSPKEDLKVSVKKIANGAFSTYANEVLKAGDAIDVMVPEGKFQLHTNANHQKNYLAFAAGSGITPIMSMIKTVLIEEPESKFFLVFGNRTAEQAMFFRELLGLQLQYPEQLFIEFVYSREQVQGSTYGRIEKPVIEEVVTTNFKDYSFNDYFLCGPEAMIQTVKEVLTAHGAAAEAIHFELFTTSAPVAENTEATGTASIEILVDDEEFTIEADKNTTLLDAALAADIDAPHSCKGGVCCSCICRVTEGEAHMPNNNLLTDDEIEEGLILACMSYAKSDSLKLDFDDA